MRMVRSLYVCQLSWARSTKADQAGNESDKQMEETGDVPKNQAVIELDMNTWRVSS